MNRANTVITRVHYSYGPARKKPKAGDERFLKGRGVTQIRQQVYSDMYRAMVVSGSRPVWEWVDKGGIYDRTSEAWRATRKAGGAQ